VTYKDVRGAVGGGFAALDELGGTLLNACHGGSAHDVAVGISVGNDTLSFCVLLLVNDFWSIKGRCSRTFVLSSVVNMVLCVQSASTAPNTTHPEASHLLP
jgi:hypothetical protein